MKIRLKTPRGFSIVELLVVMGIIMLLAGLLIGIASYVNRTAKLAKVKTEIKALENALEAYKAEHGAYPPLDPLARSGAPTSTSGRFCNGFYYWIWNSFAKDKAGWNMSGNYARPWVIDPSTNPQTFLFKNPEAGAALTAHYGWLAGAPDPRPSGWLNSQFIYRALSGTNSSTGKVFYQFRPEQLAQAMGGNNFTPGGGVTYIVLDPFGNPYGYNIHETAVNLNEGNYDINTGVYNGGPSVNAHFDLFSLGVDGIPSYPTNITQVVDDIGNWSIH